MGGARLAQLAAGVDEGFREDNQATADIGVRRSDDEVAGYAPGSRDHTVGRADELTGLDGRDGAGWFDRGILKDGGPNARMFTCGSPAIPQLAYLAIHQFSRAAQRGGSGRQDRTILTMRRRPLVNQEVRLRATFLGCSATRFVAGSGMGEGRPLSG